MSLPVLICDDSSLARKQMARSLPADWAVDVTFATQGEEGLEALRKGQGEVMFLDLNMPVKDGYEVLEAIAKEDLNTMVIVVSGDIQPEARKRVMQLGALDFIKKPVDTESLREILQKFGILSDAAPTDAPPVAKPLEYDFGVNYRDIYQEISNVAMGQAADLLARLLGVFVQLPVPNVNTIELGDLQMALSSTEQDDTVSAVCQGFIGSGVAGEALLIFNDSSFSEIATLMKYQGEIDENVERELLMDIANILIGAYLKGIAEQMDMHFSQGHPVLLGQHIQISDLLKNKPSWKKTLAIEINYGIENHQINCDLLILFTEDSLEFMNKKVEYLAD